jgi:hypothetical protein
MSQEYTFNNACARGDYQYVQVHINNTSDKILNIGIKNAVIHKQPHIVSLLFNSKKITNRTFNEITNITISTHDIDILNVIAKYANRKFEYESLKLCFDIIENKKTPNKVNIDMLNVLLSNTIVDKQLIMFSHNVCGYERVLTTLVNIFTQFKDYDDIRLQEYIFMFTPMELFTRLYRHNPYNMRAFITNIDIYVHEQNTYITEKVKFILEYDKNMINTPGYQKGLTKTAINIISNENNNQYGISILSILLAKMNNVDYMTLFKYACT